MRIEHRTSRYAYLLWEFWKKDHELFPPEILENKRGANRRPHCLVFVLDGSTDEVPSTEEEAGFYRKIIAQAKRKGYLHPFVIITKIDIVESKLRKKFANGVVDDKEKEFKIAESIDNIIDGVAKKLGVDRSYIDFVENYTAQNAGRNMKIEYYALKTLNRIVIECEDFVNRPKKRSLCQIF